VSITHEHVPESDRDIEQCFGLQIKLPHWPSV
jgi:hypothetical protein